jgi:hypothetical protein
MIKLIKTIYNDKTNFIQDIVNKKNVLIKEFYNINNYKEAKKIATLQTRLGTKNVPLVVFFDENMEWVNAIWPESNPDWEKDIDIIIKKHLE